VPRAQVALAWVLQKEPITAPIVGATKLHHLDDAVAALALNLSDEEIRRLEELYVPHAVTGFKKAARCVPASHQERRNDSRPQRTSFRLTSSSSPTLTVPIHARAAVRLASEIASPQRLKLRVALRGVERRIANDLLRVVLIAPIALGPMLSVVAPFAVTRHRFL
jgi:Aldo/keto reductase family